MSRVVVALATAALFAAACNGAEAVPSEHRQDPPAPPPTLPTTTGAPTTTAADEAAIPETITTLSRLGRMTWQMYDLDFLVTHVDTYGDGYVALIYDSLSHRPEYRGIATPGHVAVSTDGVVWTDLKEQPGEAGAFTPQMLVVDNDGLLVFGRPYTESGLPKMDELLAFAWNGEHWTELPISIPVGTLTRGGELDAGYFSDGTPVFLSRRGGAWYQSDTGFEYRPAATERWPNFLVRFDTIDVWRTDSGVVMPSSTIASVIAHEGRIVAVATPGSGGQAWTSTDGVEWVPIAPIAAAWGPTQTDIVVSPEVLDAGGLGWVAVGSWTGTGAVWVSSDGIAWGLLEDVPGPAGWDVRVPWPPATVVDEQRILIYGRAYDAVLPSPSSMVWVGTVDR
jgi:hypothetical protein